MSSTLIVAFVSVFVFGCCCGFGMGYAAGLRGVWVRDVKAALRRRHL